MEKPREIQNIFAHEFQTPQKNCGISSRQRSTTANFESKDRQENHSIEKYIQLQANAAKYCSANLNELLGTDIHFKSPSQYVKFASTTPMRECEPFPSNHNENHEMFDSELKLHKHYHDIQPRRENLALGWTRDEMKANEAFASRPSEFDISNYKRTFEYFDEYNHVNHTHRPVQTYWPKSDLNSHLEDSPDPNSQADDYRKRKRKNNIQLKILKHEFSKTDNWNKEKISQVAQITGLSESQVYKWCWDQKKKVEEQESQKQNQKDRGFENRISISLQEKYFELFGNDKENEQKGADKDEGMFLGKRRLERQPFKQVNDARL